MLKAAYYLYDLVWRVCRAQADRAFGEFRVNVVLLILEINLLFVWLYRFNRDGLRELPFGVYVFLLLVPAYSLNWILFRDERKRRPYTKEFQAYSKRKRILLDGAVCMAVAAALALPHVI